MLKLNPSSSAILLLSLLLPACASFERVDLDPVANAVTLQQRSLQDPALLAFVQSVIPTGAGKPEILWNIDRLTLAAIYFHPDIALARQQHAVASAAMITARQRPNPNLNNSLTYITHLVTSSAPWIVANSLSIPIETAGKRDARVDRAAHLQSAAEQRIADTIWSIRGRLRTALLEHFAAVQSVTLLTQQISLQTQMNLLLEQQVSVGELALIELTRARISLNQLQIGLETAHKRQAESRVQVAAAIGVPVEGLAAVTLADDTWSAPPDLNSLPLRTLKAAVLQQRPDMLAALAEYEAAQSALQLEIANQYPNAVATPGYTWDLGANYWVLATSLLQLPVFHQNQGAIAEAEARRKEMAQRVTALQMKVISDVDRASAGTQAMMRKWQEVERQQRMQQDHQREVQANYDGGEIDQITWLLARVEQLATQRAALDALIESHQAANSLEDALRQPIRSVLAANLQSTISR